MTHKGKKIALATLVSSAFITPTVNADWYSSIELGFGEYNTGFSTNFELEEDDAASKAAEKLNSANTFRLSVGNYVADDVRLYAYAQTQTGKNDFNDNSTFTIDDDGEELDINQKLTFEKTDYELGFGADYLYRLDKRWSLIAGGSLGYYQSKLTYDNTAAPIDFPQMSESIGLKSENSGLSLGLNAGVGFSVSDNWVVESGVKYITQANNEHKIQYEDEFYKYNFKDATQYYLNASYIF